MPLKCYIPLFCSDKFKFSGFGIRQICWVLILAFFVSQHMSLNCALGPLSYALTTLLYLPCIFHVHVHLPLYMSHCIIHVHMHESCTLTLMCPMPHTTFLGLESISFTYMWKGLGIRLVSSFYNIPLHRYNLEMLW